MKAHHIEIDIAENGRIAVERFTEQPEGFYDAKKTDYLSLIELLFFEENFTSNVIR